MIPASADVGYASWSLKNVWYLLELIIIDTKIIDTPLVKNVYHRL